MQVSARSAEEAVRKVMPKTKIEGDHQILSFGFMQLFNMMHAEGATTTSTNTNFSPQHLEKFGVKILKS